MEAATIPVIDQADRLKLLEAELSALRAALERQAMQIGVVADLLQDAAAPQISAPEASYDAENRARGEAGLPVSKSIRQVIRQRQNRQKILPGHLFADPAWDMLLDLAAAKSEGRKIAVTSLCIASGVPMTTALRWIGILIDEKLVERRGDPADRRRMFLELTDEAASMMAGYFNSAEDMFSLCG